MNSQVLLKVTESSQVAAARRRAIEVAESAGLDETDTGKVGLLVTELGTNLVKHAIDGQLIVRAPGENVVEVMSLDRGPGIANVSKCLGDGFSTTGSPGTGLGALTRLSSEYDIHSVPQKGTIIVMRVTSRVSRTAAVNQASVGVVCIAKPGEDQCGDGWAIETLADGHVCAVADGLGHGPDAAKASQLALQCFRERSHRSPKEIVERVHEGIRSTRGAALSVAQVNREERLVRFAGVGNVAGLIIEGNVSRHMVSLNGTLGYQVHRVTEFAYPWSETSLLIMHSDGLSTHWDLSAYPGLLARDPSLIAGVLYRDFARGRDDVTVLAVKESTPHPTPAQRGRTMERD
jgi:anti-sigma regulatory factor (Ser/Thr protein kinase)